MPWYHEDENNQIVCQRKGDTTYLSTKQGYPYISECVKCWRECKVATSNDEVIHSFNKSRDNNG